MNDKYDLLVIAGTIAQVVEVNKLNKKQKKTHILVVISMSDYEK